MILSFMSDGQHLMPILLSFSLFIENISLNITLKTTTVISIKIRFNSLTSEKESLVSDNLKIQSDLWLFYPCSGSSIKTETRDLSKIN